MSSDEKEKLIRHLVLLVDIANRVTNETAYRDTAFAMTYAKLLECDSLIDDLLTQLLVNNELDVV